MFDVLIGIVLVVMCCFVFFFKQKTAYDMRISDGSSDVCSSDLVVDPHDSEIALLQRTFGLHDLAIEDSMSDVQPAKMDLYADHVFIVEIGRASCRERVCQYV